MMLKSMRKDNEAEIYIIRYSETEKILVGTTSDDVSYFSRIPNVKTNNYVTLPPKKIYEFLKAVAAFSNSVKIALSMSGIELTVKTTKTTIATIIPREDITLELTNEGSETSYPINECLYAFNAMKNAAAVKIGLGEKDKPMQIDFYIGRKDHEKESVARVLVAMGEY